MTDPKSSVWRGPRWSLLRKLRDWLDRRTIRLALSHPLPHREFSNVPLSVPVLKQEDIDGR